MKQTPHNGWKYPETVDLAKVPSHVEGFLLPIDAIIAQLRAIVGLGQNEFSNALADAKWRKPALVNPDANTVEAPGTYPVNGASASQNLPVIANGELTVIGGDAYKLQTYTTWRTGVLQYWIRRKTSSGWEAWQAVNWLRDNLAKDTDFNSVTGSGYYGCATTTTNGPETNPLGFLEVVTTAGATVQKFTTRYNKTYTRTLYGGTWSAWNQLANQSDLEAVRDRVTTLESGTGGVASTSEANPRRAGHDVRVSRAVQLVGKRTSNRAQVAIIFDHGSIAFRDIVFPKLQELGLTATLAVNSGRLDPSYAYAAKEIQDWTPLKSWYDAGIEIANHGRTHQDWDTPQGVYDEIVTGMDELEAAMARPIHSWVQPGAIGNLGGYMGFTNGNSYAKYWGTEAGALIMENHAFVTGTVYPADRHYRLQGEPVIGAHGFWLDGGATQLDAAKTAVMDAESRKTGVLLRGHPQSIDASASNTTTTELYDFLGWVAGERDAGRIDVVTFAQWNLTEVV